MKNKHNLAGLIAGLVAASIWGGMYVVSKIVLDIIPPFALLASRLILGALTLGVVIAARQSSLFRLSSFNAQRKKKDERTSPFWMIFLVGFVGYGLSLGFQFVGTKLSTASNGALVTSATPAFVLIFAPFILGEKTTLRRIFALILSSLGVLAVIDPRNAELSPSLFWGNLSLLAAALTWALYSVLVRKASRDADLLTASAIMLLGGLPISVPWGLYELGTKGMGVITPGILIGILFLGIVSTAIAMFLWNYAFAELPAAVASLTFFAQPVVGTLLGWFFLSEKITPLFIFGGVLIAIGILISNE